MKKLTIIGLLIILNACTTNTMNLQSSIQVPSQFDQIPTSGHSTEIIQWWKNWNDPQLTMLIQQGLQNNLDVAVAKARLQEAQAGSRYNEAELGPTVGIQGNVGGIHSRAKNPLTHQFNDNTGAMQVAALKASWELDFFGKKQSDADAALAVELGAQEQVYATQMLVSSQIAQNYANIFALQQQQTVLKQSENTLQRLKNYVQGRFNAGQVDANNILEIESRISAIQAQQATLSSQIAANERTIAILIGKPPQGFKLAKSAVNFLNVLPNAPSGVLPGEVIARRPDLRAAQHQIQAQAAKLASAKADLYPRFDIQFLGQTGRIDLDGNGSDLKGFAGLLSAGISVPIFTNGRIQANIDASDARLKNALLQYDKALIQALAEVDNRYQAQFALNRQTQLAQTAVHQAQRQAENAEKLFKYGEKTLDNALTAKLNALDYQQRLIQAKLNRANNLINLYKALGGGWEK